MRWNPSGGVKCGLSAAKRKIPDKKDPEKRTDLGERHRTAELINFMSRDLSALPKAVSSTFRDMPEEREELLKQIFPRLRHLCESGGVTWGEMDLRWGVPDEAKAEKGRFCLCAQRKSSTAGRTSSVCWVSGTAMRGLSGSFAASRPARGSDPCQP